MSRIAVLMLGVVSWAAAQTPLFQVLDNPIPWNASPPDAIGDIDNDGDADLVTRNGVFRNDGHGRFAPVAGAPLAFPRVRTTLADVNNDGLLDVLSVDFSTYSYSTASVRIDLNQGAMVFAGPVAGLPTVASPRAGRSFRRNVLHRIRNADHRLRRSRPTPVASSPWARRSGVRRSHRASRSATSMAMRFPTSCSLRWDRRSSSSADRRPASSLRSRPPPRRTPTRWSQSN